ncbi:MAG TPA: hypothetical protein VFE96_04670 [Candidatus Bathyarchaeia archaeon]|nr:hypothetical protein [Candidatus Bathyarchaeia archaeon]
MKANRPIRVVLVDGDSARVVRTRARTSRPFTTVRFEDTKREAIIEYGLFWTLMSRRFL